MDAGRGAILCGLHLFVCCCALCAAPREGHSGGDLKKALQRRGFTFSTAKRFQLARQVRSDWWPCLCMDGPLGGATVQCVACS